MLRQTMVVRTFAPVLAAALSCASSPPPRPAASSAAGLPTAVSPAVKCASPVANQARAQSIAALETDPSLTKGPASTELLLLRKTVVQVADHYFDVRRIDPALMLDAMVAAIADHSDGALRREGHDLFTFGGQRWSAERPDSIWQVPLAAREMERFLLARLPPDHRLVRGTFAEVVMTNALLGTLDPYSVLLPPGAYAAYRSGKSPLAYALRAAAPPEGPSEDFRFTREDVSRLRADGISYLRPGPFLEKSISRIRGILRDMDPAKTVGLILDLRGNTGGLMAATVELADLFLPSGTIVTFKGAKTEEVRTAHDEGLLAERIKLVVLVDSMTSAGAEIVAGSLRFGDRAILIGEATSGAADVSVLYDFKDKSTGDVSALRLETAQAILPGNRMFEGMGISPDLEVSSGTSRIVAGLDDCAPLGEKVGTIRVAPGDAVVLLAAEILTRSTSASRADLLAAARATASARRLSSP